MSSFEPLPGFRDFYPAECNIRNYIFNIWRRVCRAHNFVEYSVPTLQPTELFVEKSGPEIVGQLFNFTDKGGREVTLPAEATPYLAHMVGAKAAALKRPIKWFSIPECYRYERPQKGRTRSFFQLNADIFDEAGTQAELELISLTVDVFRGFGLTHEDFAVRLSDRTVWLNFLAGLGYEGEKAMGVLSIIDKWERESPEEIAKKLGSIAGSSAGTLQTQVQEMMKLTSLPSIEEFTTKNLASATAEAKALVASRLAQWKELLGDLEAAGLSDYIKVDLGIVRGLAYYTGFVFEVFEAKRPSRALAGGGRYDNLVEKLGGPKMPAMGMGLGDVTLLDLLRDSGKLPTFTEGVDFYLIYTSPATRKEALGLLRIIRDAGRTADMTPKAGNIGKGLKNADKAGASKAIILGDDELAKGIAKLKCLRSGDEREIPLKNGAELLEA